MVQPNVQAKIFFEAAVGSVPRNWIEPVLFSILRARALSVTVETGGARTDPRPSHPVHEVVALLRPPGLPVRQDQGVVGPEPPRVRLQAGLLELRDPRFAELRPLDLQVVGGGRAGRRSCQTPSRSGAESCRSSGRICEVHLLYK